MKEIVLAGAVRTPVGKFGGGLSETPATALGAIAIRESLRRAKVSPDQVEYAIMGNVLTANEGQAPARQASIRAGIPDSVSALTINKVCASGLMSVALAAQAIKAGDADVVVAGGMENMSLAPHMIVNSRTGFRLGDVQAVDHMVHDGLWCPFENRHMGGSAEAIAAKHGISRDEQDAFALRSHQRSVAAMREGIFSGEIVPVEIKRKKETVLLDRDEGPRPDTSDSTLRALRPAFPPGQSVTAGNASQISDGAASVVVMESGRARSLGSNVMAKLTGYAHAANAPAWLFDAPVLATRKLLEKTRTKLEDYDLIEVNEAFAAQVLANAKELRWDWNKVNIHGGAIAIGHPIGASGARVLVTLLHSMKRNKAKRGMAVICHGGGGAVAVAVESL